MFGVEPLFKYIYTQVVLPFYTRDDLIYSYSEFSLLSFSR